MRVIAKVARGTHNFEVTVAAEQARIRPPETPWKSIPFPVVTQEQADEFGRGYVAFLNAASCWAGEWVFVSARLEEGTEGGPK